LQYVAAKNAVLIQVPDDKSISDGGFINEGIVSTRLGLQGKPAIAEELMIARDLELLRYTNSALHITGISTAKSVELIAAAKKEGLKVTCSVTPYHLYFSDEDMESYDTNLKVNPPLRRHTDVQALRDALQAGVIDCITTHHTAQHWDDKVCEFEYAKTE
jgi:dihydroorotase